MYLLYYIGTVKSQAKSCDPKIVVLNIILYTYYVIIKLPALGKISLWSTNDLESIEANIPYQIWVYGRVLDLVIPLEVKDDVHITDHRLY